MGSLGQKLKMAKTFEKPFCKSIKIVLCKQPLEKTPNIREMRQALKSGYLENAIAHAKAIAFAKWLGWVKN